MTNVGSAQTPRSFDVTRAPRQHLTFGVGAHYCLGNALARIEGRIALDEIMNRFPDWDVDLDRRCVLVVIGGPRLGQHAGTRLRVLR